MTLPATITDPAPIGTSAATAARGWTAVASRNPCSRRNRATSRRPWQLPNPTIIARTCLSQRLPSVSRPPQHLVSVEFQACALRVDVVDHADDLVGVHQSDDVGNDKGMTARSPDDKSLFH